MATPVPVASRMCLPIVPSGHDGRGQAGLLSQVAEVDGDGREVGFDDSRGTWNAVAAPIPWKPSTAAHPSTETSATTTVNLAGEELWDAVGL